MVEALNEAETDQEHEDAERRIHEDALSVEVRGDWHAPGVEEDVTTVCDYRIPLCTGGPAVGQLNLGEPSTAHMEVQDWFTPWTTFWPEQHKQSHAEDKLLAYARCFFFGE